MAIYFLFFQTALIIFLFSESLHYNYVPLANFGATRVRTITYCIHRAFLSSVHSRHLGNMWGRWEGRKQRLNLGEGKTHGILVPVGLPRHKPRQPPWGPSSSLGHCQSRPWAPTTTSSQRGNIPACSFQRHSLLAFFLPTRHFTILYTFKKGRKGLWFQAAFFGSLPCKNSWFQGMRRA